MDRYRTKLAAHGRGTEGMAVAMRGCQRSVVINRNLGISRITFFAKKMRNDRNSEKGGIPVLVLFFFQIN
jgi:hypothetical protein